MSDSEYEFNVEVNGSISYCVGSVLPTYVASGCNIAVLCLEFLFCEFCFLSV